MNKREAVLSLLDSSLPTPYIPAAFFLHFDPQFHRGQAAIDKHLEYFRFTGMDFVKIQYETRYPVLPEIQSAADWDKMPCYGADFYQDQWNITKAAKVLGLHRSRLSLMMKQLGISLKKASTAKDPLT